MVTRAYFVDYYGGMATLSHVYIDPELIEKAKIGLGLDANAKNVVVVRQALIQVSGDNTMTSIVRLGRPPVKRQDS